MSVVWGVIFVGLSAFFLLTSRRFVGRGYELLGLAIGCGGLASWLDAAAALSGPGPLALIAARFALIVGLGAAAFNLNFLAQFCGGLPFPRAMWFSYVSTAAALFTTTIATAAQLPTLEGIAYPEGYPSPSSGFSVYVVAILLAHYLLYLWLALSAWRRGRRGVKGMALALLLLVPAAMADTWSMRVLDQKWYVAEVATWFYCLVVLGGMLSEIQGAEGKLKETSTSLARRTAELEISYAEIDLMHTELSKKQQLAAVGELAAAIAHEVRNPLAVIMNAVSGMRRPTLSATDKETLLSIVNEEAERLNHLVTELLRFARPVAASPGPASLFDICQRASQSPPDGYELVVSNPDETALGDVLVDPGLFRLALDNLVANSVQAMPDGGQIHLTVQRGRFSDGTLAATVSVRDEGCGMKVHELDGARKPFFTTKPRGTGLGIPIADRIVDAHGGEMAIESELGSGTTVTIRLPIEKELQKSPTYSAITQSGGRRRLRSIHPVGQGESPQKDSNK